MSRRASASQQRTSSTRRSQSVAASEARTVFGEGLTALLEDLNTELVA